MFDNSIKETIISAAIAVWLAHGWYLNYRLQSVHQKLNTVLDAFNGLRHYLYEIDPQFDDERKFMEHFFKGTGGAFAGYESNKLTQEKEALGRRTLNTTFFD